METTSAKVQFLINAQNAFTNLTKDLQMAADVCAVWDARGLGAGKENEIVLADVQAGPNLHGLPADYEEAIGKIRAIVGGINQDDSLSALMNKLRNDV